MVYRALGKPATPVSLAIAGQDFELLRKFLPEEYLKVVVTGSVFARMSPEQKQQLVETLIDQV